jgi:hypothetical protein
MVISQSEASKIASMLIHFAESTNDYTFKLASAMLRKNFTAFTRDMIDRVMLELYNKETEESDSMAHDLENFYMSCF